jgi:hypothetical protein
MGIRYYAYAFDSELTERALVDPRSMLSIDPLADAWGMEPDARVGVATMKQWTPPRDLLYLDKAWPLLQELTGPRSPQDKPRPAYRMFEGAVTMRGWGWEPWVRPLAPGEVRDIARDLGSLTEGDARMRLSAPSSSGDRHPGDVGYALQFLDRARAFVDGLVADGRGMVYMIG